MGTLNLLQNAKKNPWSIVILIGLAAIVVWALYDEIHDMRQAATDYDYCYHLSYLYEIICKTVFACLYLIMTYLTYINKQFSRWSIWLFYVSAIALVLHFMIAGYMFDYVYAHVDADHLDKLPSEFEKRDSIPGGVVSTGVPLISYDVNVQSWGRADHKVLLSTAQGQTYRVTMQKIKVSIPASRTGSKVPFYFIASSAIFAIIVCLWVLWLIIKLITSIRRGEIFVTKVAKYLEITGILLSVLYLNALIVSYGITQYFIANIHLADHSIVFKNECNSMYILTGLGLMIISQIILMGKDLKEEQELTI